MLVIMGVAVINTLSFVGAFVVYVIWAVSAVRQRRMAFAVLFVSSAAIVGWYGYAYGSNIVLGLDPEYPVWSIRLSGMLRPTAWLLGVPLAVPWVVAYGSSRRTARLVGSLSERLDDAERRLVERLTDRG